MKKSCPILVVLFALVTVSALAMEPIEAIQGPIEEVLSLLGDPSYRDPAQKEKQKEKIWEIVRATFDFNEMAKRTLARNWRIFTPKQRMEFTDVFSDFLGNTYLDKVQGGYDQEQVSYLSDDTMSETKAVVKTAIKRSNGDIPLDYSVRLTDGAWRIYDVNIEGVSLVKNYRTQFNKFLINKSPAELIERLRKKVEQQEKGEAVSDEMGAVDDKANLAARLYGALVCKYTPREHWH
ncbi:phospholipid-binding protein MlaC [Thermodesulfobacteriota bacterium]